MNDPRQLPVPESWAGLLNRWATQLTSEACSPQTIATRLDHMRRISRAMGCPPDQVTADQLISWCGDQTWARETRRSVYTSARKFWRWFISTPAGSGVVSPADSLPHVRATDPAPRPAPAVVIQTGLIDADPLRTGPEWIALARSVVSFCDLGGKTFANPLALPTPHV